MPGQGDSTARNVKKKKRSLGPSEPPSPTLSAVHASGVSTPIPKVNLSGSSATTPTSSVILNASTSAANVVEGAATGSGLSRKSSKLDMKAQNNNEEAQGYSPWFIRSWPRGKSSAVTQVASENIVRENPPPTPPDTETTTFAPPRDPESHSRPEITKLDPTPPQIGTSGSTGLTAPPVITPTTIQTPAPSTAPTVPDEAADSASTDKPGDSSNTVGSAEAAASGSSSWIGWIWSAPPPPQNATATEMPKKPDTQDPEPTAVESPIESAKPTEPMSSTEAPVSSPADTAVVSAAADKDETGPTQPAQQPGSWFGWLATPSIPGLTSTTNDEATGSTQPESASESVATKSGPEVNSAPVQDTQAPKGNSTQKGVEVTTIEPQTAAPEQPANPGPVNVRGSTWAFWYRGSPGVKPDNNGTGSVVGEVAVADTPSQHEPQVAKIDKLPAPPSSQIPQANGKANKSASSSGDEGKRRVETGVKDKGASAPTTTSTIASSPAINSASPAKHKLQKICPPNHLFPSFESCYHRLETPSVFCKLTKIFKPSKPEPKTKHLYIVPTPPKIKKAVAIGVHGFFPMRLVRTVLGEPTGTSVRFAEAAAAAIKRWAEANEIEIEIEKVALEGEGKVADRVETLWKLLENWMDHVKSADFILIAAHSQGVVVGIQLLARMIEEGCVDNARVGFAAMAGINLGPFYHLPTSILTGAAKELFEFQKSESAVSKKYIQALRTVLAHHVRLLFVGSIDDQLVPLESSTFSNIHHPYIFRAVFIDGRVHAPDFLSHLVGFAMKLRNIGISEHGLIRELSVPLAGNLYNGEGHSRIYDDNAVYDLAVRHSLETTECPDVPLRVESFVLPTSPNNPFFLPWSMRGLLEEDYVRTRLAAERDQLLKQFENWHPVSKPLKDVKFRLDAIRSKL